MRKTLLFTTLIIASPLSYAGDFGLGLGHAYGGLGAQLSVPIENVRFRAGLGAYGGMLGFDQAITSRQALGVSFGSMEDYNGMTSVDWHFFLGAEKFNGFNFGVSILSGRRSGSNFLGRYPRETFASINLGYIF